jgi:hypothetical protein
MENEMTVETVNNASYLLGDNKTENLVIEGLAAAVIEKGALLTYNKLTGRYKKYAGGVETIEAICAVATVIPEAGYIDAPCSVAGLYNGAALVLPSGVALDTVQKSKSTAIAITPGAGNTGNGTAGAITQGALAKAGTYRAVCINAASSGAEIFGVFDPEGNRLADLTVGAAYNNGHFAVTIADASYDFIVGDTFAIVPQVNAAGSPRMLMAAKGMLTDDVVQMHS